jgi:hypothetical protein
MSAWWLLPAFIAGLMTLPLLLVGLHELLLRCNGVEED